jgi:hypothetical protein
MDAFDRFLAVCRPLGAAARWGKVIAMYWLTYKVLDYLR